MSKLTIKEIHESKQALHRDREQLEDDSILALEKDFKVYSKHLKTLREDETAAHNKLIKDISKLFKGMKATVKVANTGLHIVVLDKAVLGYAYNGYSFNGISKELANEAIELYKNEYGEPVEEVAKARETLEKLDMLPYLAKLQTVKITHH